jgi:hypothetical protein
MPLMQIAMHSILRNNTFSSGLEDKRRTLGPVNIVVITNQEPINLFKPVYKQLLLALR